VSTSNEDLAIQVATLKSEMKSVIKTLEKQDNVLASQSMDIRKLLDLASKGSGALWALMGIATLFGAVVSNLKSIIGFLTGP
jgi:hypothetical protein